jgi:hypothetical protein
MPASNPSPPPDAASTTKGLLTAAAQTIGGVKTFLALIVASAGLQIASLFNTNGTGGSDVVLKVGTSQPSASVNANARLFSIYTGIGGSETEELSFYKSGFLIGGSASLQLSGASGAKLSYLGAVLSASEFVNNQAIVRSGLGSGASDVCVLVGTGTADATVNGSAKLVSVRTGIGGTQVEKAYFRKAGSLVVGADTATPVCLGSATDLANIADGFKYNAGASEIGVYSSNNATFLGINLGTGGARSSGAFTSGGVVTGTGFAVSTAPPLTAATGTPGATVTQNADKGRITVPSGATSVVVTNSAVGANSFVGLEWESLPSVTHSIAYAAGSFTVTFSAALGSSLTFRYFVVR